MSENQKEAPQTPDAEVESTSSAQSVEEQTAATPKSAQASASGLDLVYKDAKSGDEPAPQETGEAVTEDGTEDGADLFWPRDPDHQNAISVLSEPLKGVELVIGDERKSFNRALNLILIMLCLGIAGSGTYLLGVYASPDRDARLRELALCRNERSNFEQEHANYDIERYRGLKLSDTQITQKLAASFYVSNERAVEMIDQFNLAKQVNPTQRFILPNTLSIITDPKNALVYKRRKGEKEYQKLLSASGEHNRTPVKIQLDDINDAYEFKLTLTKDLKRRKELTEEEKKALKEGEKGPTESLPVVYREETFRVGRYQWVKEAASGNFTFNQSINPVPDYQDEFYTFDWAKGKSHKFETMDECREFESSNDATICRPLPRPETWIKFDEREEEKSKKSKKSKKRGRRR